MTVVSFRKNAIVKSLRRIRNLLVELIERHPGYTQTERYKARLAAIDSQLDAMDREARAGTDNNHNEGKRHER